MMSSSFTYAMGHLAQASIRNDDKNNTLVQQIRLIDSRKIEECNTLIEEIKIKEGKLKDIYVYTSKDRQNIQELVGSNMTSVAVDPNTDQNLKILTDKVDNLKSRIDKMENHVLENKKLNNVPKAKIEYLRKLIEINTQKIESLKIESDDLKVRNNLG